MQYIIDPSAEDICNAIEYSNPEKTKLMAESIERMTEFCRKFAPECEICVPYSNYGTSKKSYKSNGENVYMRMRQSDKTNSMISFYIEVNKIVSIEVNSFVCETIESVKRVQLSDQVSVSTHSKKIPYAALFTKKYGAIRPERVSIRGMKPSIYWNNIDDFFANFPMIADFVYKNLNNCFLINIQQLQRAKKSFAIKDIETDNVENFKEQLNEIMQRFGIAGRYTLKAGDGTAMTWRVAYSYGSYYTYNYESRIYNSFSSKISNGMTPNTNDFRVSRNDNGEWCITYSSIPLLGGIFTQMKPYIECKWHSDFEEAAEYAIKALLFDIQILDKISNVAI